MFLEKDFRIKRKVSYENLEYNFLKIRSVLPKEVKMMCVVKADSYGLGSVKISKLYEKWGAEALAVANIDEAILLRENKVNLPILVLGYTEPSRVGELYKFDISQTVFSSSYANCLLDFLKEKSIKINVHLKIDTGMSRIGFFFQDRFRDIGTLDEIEAISYIENFNVTGIYTHFLASEEMDDFGKTMTGKQIESFNYSVDFSKKIFKNLEFIHCSNSGAIINYPNASNNYVRAGIILYGYYPCESLKNKILLKEALEIKTVVVQIKEVPTGTRIGYGGTFVTKKKSKIATIPIGYADGLNRKLSNKGHMLINGHFAPIVGNICMDQCMLDVTNIENIKEGDIVTIVGKDGENTISIDDISRICGTINYEILCNFKSLRSEG